MIDSSVVTVGGTAFAALCAGWVTWAASRRTNAVTAGNAELESIDGRIERAFDANEQLVANYREEVQRLREELAGNRAELVANRGELATLRSQVAALSHTVNQLASFEVEAARLAVDLQDAYGHVAFLQRHIRSSGGEPPLWAPSRAEPRTIPPEQVQPPHP